METANANRMLKFGSESTADEVLEGVELTGKTVLITGGTSGLGEESARALAARGAKVITTGRSKEKAQAAFGRISEATGVNVEVEELELASFASIRAFANRILQREWNIDILILNAGVMACPEGKTADGFEQQFGTNHLGHFLMTNLVAEKMAEGGRVVSLSSAGHQFSPIVFEDIQFEQREYDPWLCYGQSKTANALFAVALNERLAARNIEAFAVHPGAIMTDLSRYMTEEDIKRFQAAIDAGTLKVKSTAAGAATQVLAATAPELTGRGGAYLSDCRVCRVNDINDSWDFVRSYAVNAEIADRLWEVSEQMVGEEFKY